MELCRENGTRAVNDTFVRMIIQIDKVFPKIVWQGRGIDGIAVVLGCDCTLSRGKVHGGNIMRTVSVCHFYGLGTCSEGEELMAHAYGHDGDLGAVHDLSEVIDSDSSVRRVTRSVREENPVEMLFNFA